MAKRSAEIAPDLESNAVPIDDLVTWTRNPRRGDVPAVAASLEAFGQRTPIVYRTELVEGVETKVVYAGNHRLLAARQLGWDRVAAVAADDLSPDEIRGFALADNRTSDLGTYDGEELSSLLLELDENAPELVTAAAYSIEDMDDLLAELEVAPTPELVELNGDPDEVPDVVEGDPVTQLGDVWVLGEHRLVCGDAYDEANHPETADMVLTDPPYGMKLDTDYRQMPNDDVDSNTYRPVIGDDREFDMSAVPVPSCVEQFWWGAEWYRSTIPPTGGSWIVWDKRNEQSDELIGSSFELCWSAVRHRRIVLRHHWAGFTAHDPGETRVHPTQKSIAMLAEMLDRWSKADNLVLDPFGGSGSTLIACHQTNRRCHAIELDPHYCDVICRRFQTLTGIVPTRDGDPHDFTGGEQ